MRYQEVIADYIRTQIPDYNSALYERSDMQTVIYLMHILRSFERDTYFKIKIKSFRIIEDEKDINAILHAQEKEYGNRRLKYNQYDYINLKETNMFILEVIYYLETIGGSEEVIVYIDIPRIVDKYFFYVDGVCYLATHQVVDASTYIKNSNKASIVVFKTSFRAFNNYRYKVKLKTIKREEVACFSYENATIVPQTRTQIPKYFLAKFGFYGAMQYLYLRFLSISQFPDVSENVYCFEKRGVFFTIDKRIFEENPVMQSMIYCIIDTLESDPDMTIRDIFNQNFWLAKLGEDYGCETPEKGWAILDSFEHLYDSITYTKIHLPHRDKADVYALLRWISYQFKELRAKSNTNISTKRVRFEEYIAVIYASQLSKRIIQRTNNINNVTLSQLKKTIMIKHDWLLKNIKSAEGLIAYNDTVNDNTGLVATEFTYKGIQGIGSKKTSAVPVSYRMVYPNQLGNVDIDTSSNSDPGMSGTICPYAQLYNGSFSEFEEPNNWRESLNELYGIYEQNNNIIQAFPNRTDLIETNSFISNIARMVQEVDLGEIGGYPMEASGTIQYFAGTEEAI